MRTTGGGAAAVMVALSTFVSFLGPYPLSLTGTTTNRIGVVTSASSLFVHGLVTTTKATPTKTTTIGGRRSATATTTLSTWWVRTSSTDLPPWRPNPLVRSRHSRFYSSSIVPSSSSPERGDIDKNVGGNVDPVVTSPPTPQPPSQPSILFPPPWLRLAGYAPVEYRLEVTNQVSDAISSSGGYLGMTTLLSNLVTSMLLEDIDPTKLGIFYDKLRSIPNLRLNPQTVTLLEECSKYLETMDNGTSSKGNETIAWKPIAGVFQLTWTGADGRLRHQIVADG